MSSTDGGRGAGSVSDRLNYLFASVPRTPGSRELHNNETVSAAMSAGGVPVSSEYLSMLRTGRRSNPSRRVLTALADVFRVPLSYFDDPEQAARIRDELPSPEAARERVPEPSPDTASGRDNGGKTSEEHADASSLSDRLNYLFATVPRTPGSRELHNNETVSAAMSAGGVPVSSEYLSMLRTGGRSNPSRRVLTALAAVFGVPLIYFYAEGEAARIRSQIDALITLRDTQVEQLLLRTRGLSRDGIDELAATLDGIRSREGLNNEPHDETPDPTSSETF